MMLSQYPAAQKPASFVLRLITYVLVGMALSIISELVLFSWNKQGLPYPDMTQYVVWILKHVVVTIFLVLVVIFNDKITSHKLKKVIIFFVLGGLFSIAQHLGFDGTPFCGSICTDTAPLIIPFVFAFVAAITGLLLYLWCLLSKSPFVILFLLGLVSAAIILFSLWRPIYQDKLAQQFIFFGTWSWSIEGFLEYDDKVKDALSQYDEKFPSQSIRHPMDAVAMHGARGLERLRVVFSNSPEISVDDWDSLCKKWQKSSLGFDAYGMSIATQCYNYGSIFYYEPAFCTKLSAGSRKNCELQYQYMRDFGESFRAT